jgi:hypothetical protein
MIDVNRSYLLAFGVLLMVSQTTFAASDSDSSMPDREALETALSECAASLEEQSGGMPDRDAMDSCMSEKGFSKPSGPPGHHVGAGGRPPER